MTLIHSCDERRIRIWRAVYTVATAAIFLICVGTFLAVCIAIIGSTR